MMGIKKIVFSLALASLTFIAFQFVYSDQRSLPENVQQVSIFCIFLLAPLCSVFFHNKLFGSTEEPIEFGNIKWFNSRKGYGFISADHGDEIFVHFRNIEEKETANIREGQRVKFVTISSEKGLQADKVSFI